MSENEEMYLVTIARANEEGRGPIPLAQLALALNVQPVSANQMIRKLEKAGKVTYMPYKGVMFTNAGRTQAARILRRRRLWEVFLAKLLGFSPREADEIACRLEHATSDVVAERLSAFLGSPQTSPLGKPIPAPRTPAQNPPALDSPLALMPAGAQVAVSAIQCDEAGRAFLLQSGIVPDAPLNVIAVQVTGACLVRAGQSSALHLSAEMAQAIRVRPPIQPS